MASAWDILKEYEFYGTFTSRPDNSGIRSKGADKKPIKRGGDYPYDMTEPDQMYGNPAAYGRSGPDSTDSLHNPLVPHDVEHSAWDDREDEAMGTPTNFGMSGQGQLGSNIPGAVGHGWADRPMKPWDEEDEDDPCQAIDLYARKDEALKNDEDTLDGSFEVAPGYHDQHQELQDEGLGAWGMRPGQHEVMPPEEVPDQLPKKKAKDGDLADQLAGEMGLSDPDEFQGGSMPPSAMRQMVATEPFSASTTKNLKRSRGGTSSESVWRTLERFIAG